MTDSLVVIRTFANVLEADTAQIELLNAGIHSLLLSDGEGGVGDGEPAQPVALAVNQRDSEVANAVLTPIVNPL